MTNLLWTLGAIAVCAGMFFIAARMEPHWVAKDGTRFITTSQLIDRFGETIGRRREVRVALLPDGSLMVSRRSIIKTSSGVWRIQAKSPNPPKGRQIYLLREIPPDPDGELLALRVPASSKIVPSSRRHHARHRSQRSAGRQRSDTSSRNSAMGSAS